MKRPWDDVIRHVIAAQRRAGSVFKLDVFEQASLAASPQVSDEAAFTAIEDALIRSRLDGIWDQMGRRYGCLNEECYAYRDWVGVV